MPALIERPKMTRAMYQALKKHIIAEREKKKQAEQEADAELERQRKEEEIKRKKEEEDSLTLEQTKEQIAELNTKLDSLRNKKHELFSELKKVLHQDEESRKRAQLKEQQNEILMNHQFAQTALTTSSGHPAMYYQGSQTLSGRPALYKPAAQVQPTIMTGMKRQRSPSPPPASMFQQYGGGDGKFNYPTSKPQHGPFHSAQKSNSYSQATSSHATYATPSGYPSVATGGASSKYNPANQSAFTSYPSHYAHQQKQITDPPHHYHNQPGYPLPRQPGYHSIQQQQQTQMEAGSTQKPTYPDDKFKIQTNRGHPQQSLLPGQISAMPSTTSKGSIVTGYPVRTQASHQTTSSQNVYGAQGSAPRHSYPQQGRFY